MRKTITTASRMVRSAFWDKAGAGAMGLSLRFVPVVVGGLALSVLFTLAVNRTSASATDDERAIAEFDTQYQAAVKKNDAATMDRILAEDFILVTGSGKT